MVEKAKKKWMKAATKAEAAGKPTSAFAHEHDSGAKGKQAETLMKAARHRALKVHKASASPKTIRQSMYGHKE